MSIVKLNNQGVKNATAFGSISSLGSMTFIKKLTASSSATLSFVDGSDGVVLDNTYKEYVFTFKDIHPATDGVNLTFNMSVDAGSNYNVTKTTTNFQSAHSEDDATANITYRTGDYVAQSTADQQILVAIGNDNDQIGVGTLKLFNPSSTTFVKHFISVTNTYLSSNRNYQLHIAGYGNTTNPVNAVQFKMSSGNIDAGDICLYGIA